MKLHSELLMDECMMLNVIVHEGNTVLNLQNKGSIICKSKQILTLSFQIERQVGVHVNVALPAKLNMFDSTYCISHVGKTKC